MNTFVFFLMLLCNVSSKNLSNDDFAKSARHHFCKEDKEEKVLTPLSQEDLVEVLSSSHEKIFAKKPIKTRLAMAWAQIALENSRGKEIWNHNLGNIGPIKRSHAFYDHSHGYAYRSYPSFEDGAMAYWSVIKRCYSALRHFDTGDALSAAQGLKKCNYFQAPVDGYAKNLASLYNEVYHRRLSSVRR